MYLVTTYFYGGIRRQQGAHELGCRLAVLAKQAKYILISSASLSFIFHLSSNGHDIIRHEYVLIDRGNHQNKEVIASVRKETPQAPS